MGGYWACRMASKYYKMAVMVNPSTNPQESLMELVGEHVNYITNEHDTLTKENVESYNSIDLYHPDSSLVLLDKGDEVIDAYKTANHLKDRYPIEMFEGGCHRFEHMAESLDIIEECYLVNKE